MPLQGECRRFDPDWNYHLPLPKNEKEEVMEALILVGLLLVLASGLGPLIEGLAKIAPAIFIVALLIALIGG